MAERAKLDVMYVTKDICDMFNVTPMTVFNWRKGNSDKTTLPFQIRKRGKRHSIFFFRSSVEAWVEENDMFTKMTDSKIKKYFP